MKITNQLIFIGVAILLTACNSPKNKNITFKEITGEAVLIGKNITLHDTELNKIRTSEEGTVVKLRGVSDSLFLKTDDYCDAFKYVKIEGDSIDLLVDGRNVYQISNSKQDTSFQYQNKEYELKATSFYGVGFANDDGLTFCSKYYEPVVLTEKESGHPKLISLLKNNILKEATRNNEFNFLELQDNDQARDKIEKIEIVETGVILTIKREFQEGWNTIQVRLILNSTDYQSEYLNYGEINY